METLLKKVDTSLQYDLGFLLIFLLLIDHSIILSSDVCFSAKITGFLDSLTTSTALFDFSSLIILIVS
jgi:hypothetical protein